MTNIVTNLLVSLITTVATNPPALVYQKDSAPCPICHIVHHQQAIYSAQVVEFKWLKSDAPENAFNVVVSQRVLSEILSTNEVPVVNPFQKYLQVPGYFGERWSTNNVIPLAAPQGIITYN